MRTTTQILDHVRAGSFNLLTAAELGVLARPCQDASPAGRRSGAQWSKNLSEEYRGPLGPASASEGEGITSTVPQAVEGDPYAVITEELESLVGTQSDAELAALATDTQPAELLVDDNGEVIAGYYVKPTFSTFAIGVRGPGCAVGDACAWNGTNNGWYGTGSKYISISSVTRISAGSYATTFWRSQGNGDYVAANKTINFESGRAYNQITRS